MQDRVGGAGEAPRPVRAASGPADCLATMLEAWRIATRLMTPVMVLSDVFVANGAEPWRVPEMSELTPIPVRHPEATDDDQPFRPYARDDLLSRPWAVPGTPGLEHRIGGLEKKDGTGAISYDPENHQHMVELRAQKVNNAQLLIPPLAVDGPETGDVLLLGWGGTMGACREAATTTRDGCRRRSVPSVRPRSCGRASRNRCPLSISPPASASAPAPSIASSSEARSTRASWRPPDPRNWPVAQRLSRIGFPVPLSLVAAWLRRSSPSSRSRHGLRSRLH